MPGKNVSIAVINTNAPPLLEPGAGIITAFDLSLHYNEGITQEFIITGTLDKEDDGDYFKFSFEKDMTGTLHLTNLDGDVDLGLYKSNGATINYVYKWGNADLHMDTDLYGHELIFKADETYYAELFSFDKKNTGYTLSIDFNPPTAAPSTNNGVVVIDSNQAYSPSGEPGHNIANAFHLPPYYTQGVTKAFDITGTLDGNDYNDYFKFSFEQDMTGTLSLTNLDADVDLALYHGSNNKHGKTINYMWKWGNVDLHMDSDFDGQDLVFEAGANYYARLYSYDRLPTSYNLLIEFDPIA